MKTTAPKPRIWDTKEPGKLVVCVFRHALTYRKRLKMDAPNLLAAGIVPILHIETDEEAQNFLGRRIDRRRLGLTHRLIIDACAFKLRADEKSFTTVLRLPIRETDYSAWRARKGFDENLKTRRLYLRRCIRKAEKAFTARQPLPPELVCTYTPKRGQYDSPRPLPPTLAAMLAPKPTFTRQPKRFITRA
jgi:hypothetical protein